MGHNRDIFSIFFNMKVYCVFSLESFEVRGYILRNQNYLIGLDSYTRSAFFIHKDPF